ncbi:MAG: 5-oxoprolinase subunit PxpB [Desulfohalobiaceae bacterium]|nr:5-oxoprolinase subunit PxpB [Desulfohalobiaceae bacterium]
MKIPSDVFLGSKHTRMTSFDDEQYPLFKELAEDSLLVEFEPEISPETNRKVVRLAQNLEKEAPAWLISFCPTYRSLVVYFDPFRISLEKARETVARLTESHAEASLGSSRLIRLPVVFGGEYGPDLPAVSAWSGLSEDEVVAAFCESSYPVYFLGFTCSLAYMGGLPHILQKPRLDTPRQFVSQGSVGFASQQTVVLPVNSPSGYNFIGRCFVPTFNPREIPPISIHPGDVLTFRPVTEDEAKAYLQSSVEDFLEVI